MSNKERSLKIDCCWIWSRTKYQGQMESILWWSENVQELWRNHSLWCIRDPFDEGVVPENWKEANISPIFKKGKRTDAGNYRPVSLTSVPCKVMESIVRDTLLHNFEKKDLLTSCQHGLRGGSLALQICLRLLIESWTRLLDAGYGIDYFIWIIRRLLILCLTGNW